MAYKQKPKSIQYGTSSHRKAINLVQVRNNLVLNRKSDANLEDGRAKSSAFQKTVSEKDKENAKTSVSSSSSSNTTTTWQEPTTTSTDTKNEDGTIKTTVKKNQKGEEKTVTDGAKVEKQATTPEEIAAYKKYLKGVEEGTIERNTKYDKKTTVKPLEKNSSSETNTELKKPKKCTCTNPVGVVLTYKCGEAQPKACGLDKKKKCQDRPGYAEKKAKCAEGRKPGRWNEKYCSCLRDKTNLQKIGEKIGDIKFPKKKPKGCKKGSLLAQCMGSDGGKGPNIRKKNRR